MPCFNPFRRRTAAPHRHCFNPSSRRLDYALRCRCAAHLMVRDKKAVGVSLVSIHRALMRIQKAHGQYSPERIQSFLSSEASTSRLTPAVHGDTRFQSHSFSRGVSTAPRPKLTKGDSMFQSTFSLQRSSIGCCPFRHTEDGRVSILPLFSRGILQKVFDVPRCQWSLLQSIPLFEGESDLAVIARPVTAVQVSIHPSF
jgi:hypothetical protein